MLKKNDVSIFCRSSFFFFKKKEITGSTTRCDSEKGRVRMDRCPGRSGGGGGWMKSSWHASAEPSGVGGCGDVTPSSVNRSILLEEETSTRDDH